MCRLYGSHSGENVGHHVVLVLRDWGIASRIGYIITDNEAANGTILGLLHKVGPLQASTATEDSHLYIRLQWNRRRQHF